MTTTVTLVEDAADTAADAAPANVADTEKLMGYDFDPDTNYTSLFGHLRSTNRPANPNHGPIRRRLRTDGALGGMTMLGTIVVAFAGAATALETSLWLLAPAAALTGGWFCGGYRAWANATGYLSSRVERIWDGVNAEADRAVQYTRHLPEARIVAEEIHRLADQAFDLCVEASQVDDRLVAAAGFTDRPRIWTEWHTSHDGIDEQLRGEAARDAHDLRTELDTILSRVAKIHDELTETANAAEDAYRARERYAAVREVAVDDVDLTALREHRKQLTSDAETLIGLTHAQ